MSSSTPQSAGSKGNVSFEGVFVSPSTRRQPLSASGTPVLENCPGNDDERERKQRRRSRVINLQFSTESPLALDSPSSKQTETSLPAIPQLTNAQIADHYSTCIKLSTENKITTKNVFGLHLIDYMTEILKQKDSELTNFKVAAGTLDASAKIYAVRVDAVHADVYRVLGGLGKDSASSGPVADQDDPGGGGDAEPNSSRKTLSKKKHLYKTIEKNLNNINLSEADRRGEANPMLQKMVTSFDECSTAGVFLTTLHTQSYLSEVLFESKVTPLPSSTVSETPSSSSVDGTDLKPIVLQCVEKRPICPSLSGFLFTQWNCETHNESVSALLDKFRKSDQVFDINAEVDSDPGDYDGGPVDDFDADVLDKTVAKDLGVFSEKLEACGRAPGSSRKSVVSLGEGDVGSMCLHLSMRPSEYSYFSPRTMSMWAGPEHWRFKPRHKGDTNSERISKRKTAKKVFEINFDEEIEFELHFRSTRAATTLAKSTLESHKKQHKSNTLPADFHYDPDNLARLFLKPDNRLGNELQPQVSTSEHEDEVGEYDYNNPNDTSNFCPALQDADSDNDDPVDFVGQDGTFEMSANPGEGPSQGGELHRGISELNITTYGESNLVTEPQKVNKIYIHYAKTAKKMDMKSLKRTMWCLLTDGQKNHTDESNDTLEKSANSSVVVGQKVFSSITQDLLCRLPSAMAKNLSVPLAFACLLHLANEKNLKLQSVEDLSEVLVLQGD